MRMNCSMIYLSFLVYFLTICIVFCDSSSTTTIPSICFSISASYKGKQQILKDVQGCIFSGRLHAIIGPSGSGKTTLLNVLARQASEQIEIDGNLLDNKQKDDSAIFVQQNDILFPQLTVQETLEIAVSLKGDDLQLKDSVDKLINSLGLKKVRFSRVGDSKTRGISGGEKRRLSIGNEIIRYSSGLDGTSDLDEIHLFLDEPTSGLDAFQSQKVIELLKTISKKGKNTVIASIHQPRSTVYSLFDDVTLLSEGRIIYTGPNTEMKSHFSSLGYSCPNNVNPAEWVVDLVSIDYSSPETEAASRKRVKKLADAFFKKYSNKYNTLFKKLQEELNKKSKAITTVRRKSIFSEVKKFGILFNRAWKQVTRDKSLNIARLMSGLFSGLLFGAIYFQLGCTASTVGDRLGLLQVAAVNTAMTSLIKATTSFVTEKIIIQKERKSGSYSVLSYFISKLLAEFPLSVLFPCMTGSIIYKLCGLNSSPGRLLVFNTILVVESIASSAFGMTIGSIAPSTESAIATAPALMVVFIVFGGLYVVNAPSYLKWVPNCSLIRWAYEGLVLNEFKDLNIIPEAKYGPKSVSTGNQVLENMGIKNDRTIASTLKSQALIIAANYCFTYFSLLRQKPKPQEISNKDKKVKDEEVKDKTSKRLTEKKVRTIPPPLK